MGGTSWPPPQAGGGTARPEADRRHRHAGDEPNAFKADPLLHLQWSTRALPAVTADLTGREVAARGTRGALTASRPQFRSGRAAALFMVRGTPAPPRAILRPWRVTTSNCFSDLSASCSDPCPGSLPTPVSALLVDAAQLP